MNTKYHIPNGLIAGAVTICLLLLVFLANTPNVQGLVQIPSDLSNGPYVDEIVYRVIPNQDQRILALQAGEIEMDNSFFDPVHFQTLEADPDISIYKAARNGYGHITINCEKYPLNISSLRRAFAFAYNKTKITEWRLDGFGIDHDSLVPQPNGWCIEDDLPWHYYTAQPDIGNQILDEAGFTIDPSTGFRLAPNGDPFNIIIEHSPSCCEYGSIEAIVGVEALTALHIDADHQAADFNEYITRLDLHGDYDMLTYAINFFDNDVDWLGYEYWSEYAGVEYQNPTNFRNATYDSWRDQLLYGTTYEEVFEAASEMQKILHYNVPRLVIYENTYMQGYRNDVFTGHVEDLGRHITGPWTMRKIHKLEGTYGGTVPIAISEEPDSFNIYVTNSAYSEVILSELWPSLYKHGPDLTPWPDLAEVMLTETHSDNPAVPEGHTRFTIDIIRNATWSDGEPLTAEDVAFTFTYLLESGVYGNLACENLGELIAAYALSPFQVVLEFGSESYWHFSNFAFDYIIPQHIFIDDTGIGYEGWNTWNPVFDPAEPNVNCGPFIFSDYEAGEFYELEFNPQFHYAIEILATLYPTTTYTDHSTECPEPTTGLTNESTQQELNWSSVFSIAIISGSGIVIVFCIVLIIQKGGSQK